MTYTEDLTNKPIERLKRIHRDLDAKKVQELQRKEEDFVDSKEVIIETQRWAQEEQLLLNAGVNKNHISGRSYAHDETMRKLKVQFDDGELTPSTVHKAPPTDLETAKNELIKTGEKIAELEAELERSRS